MRVNSIKNKNISKNLNSKKFYFLKHNVSKTWYSKTQHSKIWISKTCFNTVKYCYSLNKQGLKLWNFSCWILSVLDCFKLILNIKYFFSSSKLTYTVFVSTVYDLDRVQNRHHTFKKLGIELICQCYPLVFLYFVYFMRISIMEYCHAFHCIRIS
jgi:hypothetical protein